MIELSLVNKGLKIMCGAEEYFISDMSFDEDEYEFFQKKDLEYYYYRLKDACPLGDDNYFFSNGVVLQVCFNTDEGIHADVHLVDSAGHNFDEYRLRTVIVEPEPGLKEERAVTENGLLLNTVRVITTGRKLESAVVREETKVG